MILLIRRTFHSSLRARQSPFHSANGSYRAFSSTPAAFRGTLPEFLPASSSELTDLLSTLNRFVLLPHHLTPDQQDLVYKKENIARLESEPIDITLGNVTIPLVHIDRMKDIPPAKKHIGDIIRQSQTPEDWENVLRTLEGYHNAAGRPIHQGILEMAIRKLGVANMHGLILKAVQRGQHTGVLLKDLSLVFVILNSFLRRSRESGWEAGETNKMFGMVEQVVQTMDEPAHLGATQLEKGDLRANPVIIGVVADLAARRANHAGDDADGKVEKYANRLVSGLRDENAKLQEFIDKCLEEATRLPTSESEWQSHAKTSRNRVMLNGMLTRLLPVWDALKVSKAVLGEKMPESELAKEWEGKLETAAVTAKNGLQAIEQAGHPLGFSQMYVEWVEELSTN